MNRREVLQGGFCLALAQLAGRASGAATTEAGGAASAPRSAPVEIRLNANENPLGPSAGARRAALEALVEAHRYPFALERRFTEQLAAHHGVEAERIVLGNGSTEILQMVVQEAARPGARLVVAEPTFEDVLDYRRPLPYEVVQVPLDPRRAHDIDRMRKAAGGGPALVYVCNPNNPTGTLTPSAEIDQWIGRAPEQVTFLVDEAYFEYVEDPAYRTAIDWTARRRGVVVTRTFSKIYGMAGLRLGYAVAHPETAARLREFVAYTNANAVALAAGSACLGDGEQIGRSLATRQEALAIVQRVLRDLELEYLPSHTNFVMHEVRGDPREYIGRMRERGFRVGRPFPPMLGYNRLSLGLPVEMDLFAEHLRDFRQRGWV